MPIPSDSILQRPQLSPDQVVRIALRDIEEANANQKRPFTVLHKGNPASCAAGVKVTGGYRQCWNFASVSRYVPIGPARPGTNRLCYLCDSHRGAAELVMPAAGSWPRRP